MFKALLLLFSHPIAPFLRWALINGGGFAVMISAASNLLGLDLSGAVPAQPWDAHGQNYNAAGEGAIARHLQQFDTGSAWTASAAGTADIQWGAVIGQWAGSLVLTFVIWLCIASCYKSGITSKRDAWLASVPEEYSLANKDWKYGTFQCFDDCTYCLYGFFCTGSRIADTYEMTGIGSYWTFIGAWLAMYVFSQALNLGLLILISVASLDANVSNVGHLCYFIAELFLAYWLAGKRQELRRKLGDTREGTKGMDFLCYWCCGCCTAIQEARQVDGASGTSIACCFKLFKHAPVQSAGATTILGQVVGEPVNAVTAK